MYEDGEGSGCDQLRWQLMLAEDCLDLGCSGYHQIVYEDSGVGYGDCLMAGNSGAPSRVRSCRCSFGTDDRYPNIHPSVVNRYACVHGTLVHPYIHTYKHTSR